MSTPLYIFATFTILLASPNNPTTTIAAPASPPNSKQVSFKLIHRDSDSIHSPPRSRHSYDTSGEKEEEMSDRIMRNSIPHFQRIVSKYLGIHSDDDDDDAIETDIVPSSDSFMFLVNFSIGQPPISQLLIMDSGSSLLWVECGTDLLPVFDPKKSSTFASLQCTSDYCRNYFTRRSCDLYNQCAYTQRYIKGAPSTGILATEQLTFDTRDQGRVTEHNVVFGCSHDNGNFGDGRVSGVLGLGYRPIVSLVSRLDSMFSYCIGSIFDTDYNHNKLVLGKGAAKMEGDSTSLQVINGHYYVDFQGISVGEKRLQIDPNIFKLRGMSSGVIIDSGSPATWLVQEAYETVRAEVEKMLDIWLTRVLDEERWPPLCYQGVLRQELVGFPAVTFHLGGGADLVLDIESLFFQRRVDEFCMALLPSRSINMTDLSLIGLMAQQNYNLGYDIQGNKLYIQRIDCQLLDD